MDSEQLKANKESMEKDFLPRAYQIELFEKAKDENSIIYLPTGTGKTYIAVLLVKHFSPALFEPYNESGKRIIFIVNTVALVQQQSTFLNRHTGLICKGYSGDMQVDFWSKTEWKKEIENNQVLIMTAQIFLNMITQGIMPLSKVNLLIFDECHHAVNKHPMRLIMQRCSDYEPHQLPRILAMSASLLNANVKSKDIDLTLLELERTFHSKIISVEDLNIIQRHATNPRERIEFYDPPKSFSLDEVNNIIENAILILQNFELPSKALNPATSKEFAPDAKNIKLKRIFYDISEHITEMGLYGGNQCILFHMVQLEFIKRFSDDQNAILVIDYLITQLIKIHKLLNDKMNDTPEKERIFRFSTPKILKLFEILKNFYKNLKNNEKFCCIVFVQRRFTAKVLYQILKDLSSYSEDFSFLNVEFIIGYNNDPYRTPKEINCLAKWNKDALVRFRNGVKNCIVATDVVDEGIDIPSCTLIVRYSVPMDYRAYIQSKGRARHETSHYVLLVPNNNEYGDRYNSFQNTENYLKKRLHGKTDFREKPTQEEIEMSLNDYKIEPYKVMKYDGSMSIITEHMAIMLINMYCANLLKSNFIMLTPAWVKKTINSSEGTKYQVELTLPPISPLKNVIIGKAMETLDVAKKAVALEACIQLHKIGELNDDLRPKKIEEILAEVEHLFPCMRDEEKTSSIPGTHTRKRRHDLVYPKALQAAYPQAGEPVYLHIIKIKPAYSKPSDNRGKVFHDLLESPITYGILSSKMLPEIPSFPIYMNVGELNISIDVNKPLSVPLTQNQIDKLKSFYWLIFEKIIENMKEFLIFDVKNTNNSFLIAPLLESGDIDWATIDHCDGDIREIKPEESSEIKKSVYDMALIFPSYRNKSLYVVVEVCDNLTPASCFPQENYKTYCHYYKAKHGISIKEAKQPLLAVKLVSKKINCLKPRGVSGSRKKRRMNDTEDFEEHMVPELCDRYDFPALYWLKATTLPTILHRISQLLIAEDLRQEIAPHLREYITEPPPNYKWEPLKISDEYGCANMNILQETNQDSEEDSTEDSDVYSDDSEGEEKSVITNDQEQGSSEQLENGCLSNDSSSGGKSPGSDTHDINSFSPRINNIYLDQAVNNQENYNAELKDIPEPLDYDRNIDKVKSIHFSTWKQYLTQDDINEDFSSKTETTDDSLKNSIQSTVQPPKLKMLSKTNIYGPSPVDIMKSLTTKMSNDVFDLERVETLGDSFLKFAISLYLFQEYPQLSEGPLTFLKGKLVGNLNLFYCGEQKKIPGRIKVEQFSPSTFPIPAFTVHDELKKVVIEEKKSTSILYETKIPKNEQKEGRISSAMFKDLIAKVKSRDENVSPTGCDHYFGIQVVSDKSVSDCVEAIIGTYLLSLGVEGTLKILTWFKILPEDLDIQKFLNSEVPDPQIGTGSVDTYMPWADTIEKYLGYEFKNRAFLLQALTHPSFISNRLTSSYQRLEFLGDAILDFLLTVHIYEKCGALNPGDLTDLRSALVNNITFACLAVKYRLNAALLMYAPLIHGVIDKFVKFQEKRNFKVDDELLWTLLEEEDCNVAEHVDVPKTLGDVFESVIGAIYLDCGKKLDLVWEVIYGLMSNEIELFSQNVPKQPTRIIYETQGINPKFSKALPVPNIQAVMITLTINANGEKKYFHGFGTTKKLAKTAASKQALKYLRYR